MTPERLFRIYDHSPLCGAYFLIEAIGLRPTPGVESSRLVFKRVSSGGIR
jgi:hypothetical protein